jgi:hypothetical protein
VIYLYGNQRFTSVLTKSRHLTLPSSVLSQPSHHPSFKAEKPLPEISIWVLNSFYREYLKKYNEETPIPLHQMCTRFLNACSALCKCANWMCRTCTPHHTVAGRLSVSLTQSPFAFPSNCRCGPPLTSYIQGRAVLSHARMHGTSAHIIAHCALCTACAPLLYTLRCV